ncbi:MAG: hypothetical protein KF819_25035 [Labilithrix sp.]|nr:hypothetical protein [Labilithrix sp.]
MKLLGLLALAFSLLAGDPAVAEGGAQGGALSTDRHVHGVITSVEPAVVTIASAQRTVTGRIDPARTKVTVRGKAAKLGDLKITAHAKAELCLDDVWLTIDTH